MDIAISSMITKYGLGWKEINADKLTRIMVDSLDKNRAQQGVPEPDVCPVKFVEGKMYGQIIRIHEPGCHNKN